MKKALTLVNFKGTFRKICFWESSEEAAKHITKAFSTWGGAQLPRDKRRWKKMKDKESKLIGKTLLKSAGFTDSHLRHHLNFGKHSLERAVEKVSEAKSALQGMWKSAFDMVHTRYHGRPDNYLLPKAKLVSKKLAHITSFQGKDQGCPIDQGRTLIQIFWKQLLKFLQQVQILAILLMPRDITMLNMLPLSVNLWTATGGFQPGGYMTTTMQLLKNLECRQQVFPP